MIQEVTIVNNQVQVAFSGSIYVKDAASVLDNFIDLINEGHTSFFIDLSAVDYIDSAGLGALLALHKQARARNGDVEIKDLNGLVKRSVRAHSREKSSFH